MSVHNTVQPNKSTRSRRCARCSHINPGSFLVCRECRAVLSHSEWVDIPAIPLNARTKPEFFEDDETRELGLILPPLNADAPQRLPFFQKRDTTQMNAVTDETTPVESRAKTEPIAERPLPTKEVPSIRETLTIPAISLDFGGLDLGDVVERAGTFVDGTSVFDSSMMLCIEVEAGKTPLVLRLPQQRALVFGRDDPETKERPDIDLIPYGGYNMGISRRHAALELVGKRLSIRDLKSSNGTFLNDVRLDAYEPHQLRDGDKIRLGNLALSISFCK